MSGQRALRMNAYRPTANTRLARAYDIVALSL